LVGIGVIVYIQKPSPLFADLSSTTQALNALATLPISVAYELKNSSCNRSIQSYDNVSAGKKEN